MSNVNSNTNLPCNSIESKMAFVIKKHFKYNQLQSFNYHQYNSKIFGPKLNGLVLLLHQKLHVFGVNFTIVAHVFSDVMLLMLLL